MPGQLSEKDEPAIPYLLAPRREQTEGRAGNGAVATRNGIAGTRSWSQPSVLHGIRIEG